MLPPTALFRAGVRWRIAGCIFAEFASMIITISYSRGAILGDIFDEARAGDFRATDACHAATASHGHTAGFALPSLLALFDEKAAYFST